MKLDRLTQLIDMLSMSNHEIMHAQEFEQERKEWIKNALDDISEDEDDIDNLIEELLECDQQLALLEVALMIVEGS